MSELYPEPLDDAEIAAYLAWAEELVELSVDATLPQYFEFDENARSLKTEAATTINAMMAVFASEEVRQKGYYQPGGEAEVLQSVQAYQYQVLPEIYKGVRFESPSLEFHATQETPVSCQPTCIQNAFEALGVRTTQADIAAACGFTLQAAPFPGQLMDYAKQRGFAVEEVKSIFDMIDELVDGKKVVIHLGQPAFPVEHAILVSGVRIENGTIDFIVNDPVQSQSQRLPLEVMMPHINPNQYRKLSPAYSIGITQ